METEDRLDRLVRHALGDLDRRHSELAEHRAALRALQFDLEGGSAVGRLGGEQVGHLDSRLGGDRLEERELGLTFAVLDETQLTAGDADPLTQLVEGQSV
jgi:hypothetical protein